jgi:formamidopyrimidine-DNA glycosylase
MPELPEVESVRRALLPVLLGRTVRRVEVLRDRTVRHHRDRSEVEERLVGRTVTRLRRHGKYLLGDLDSGDTWVFHLGMSGRIEVGGDGTTAHTNFRATLDDESDLRFVDPRTFGFVAVYRPDEVAASPLGRLGPDAWEQPPTPGWLEGRLKGRTAPIKALLLDQRIVAGIGNIYGDETLFRARLSPLRPGGSLGRSELVRLTRGLRAVLASAIAQEGTSLDDRAYLLPDGREGRNRPRVYGRAGMACPRCGAVLRRTTVAQRSTHFCPACQS